MEQEQTACIKLIQLGGFSFRVMIKSIGNKALLANAAIGLANEKVWPEMVKSSCTMFLIDFTL